MDELVCPLFRSIALESYQICLPKNELLSLLMLLVYSCSVLLLISPLIIISLTFCMGLICIWWVIFSVTEIKYSLKKKKKTHPGEKEFILNPSSRVQPIVMGGQDGSRRLTRLLMAHPQSESNDEVWCVPHFSFSETRPQPREWGDSWWVGLSTS